jgi:hypothetical protein
VGFILFTLFLFRTITVADSNSHKTRNNTGSFGTRTNNITTHTKLRITLEASELESITQQLTQNWE